MVVEAMKRYVERVVDTELYAIADPDRDRNGAGFPLILLVGGTMINGRLCSAREWARALQKRQADADGQPVQGEPDLENPEIQTYWAPASQFAEAAGKREAAWEANDAALTDDQLRWRYSAIPQIHLLDAVITTSNGVRIPSNGDGTPLRIGAEKH
jgi:hypothetical protein